MRGSELLDKMELVDPALVEEADAAPKKKKKTTLRWAAAAACLCIAAVGAFALTRQESPDIPDTPDVPTPPVVEVLEKLTVPEMNEPGAGYSALLCHDASELDMGNPWKEEMKVPSLPVFRNGSYDASGAGVPIGLGEERLTEILSSAADALGVKILSSETVCDGFFEQNGEMVKSDKPTLIHAETDRGTLTVMATGAVSFIPAGDGEALTGDDAEVLSHLVSAYADFLGYAEPEAVTFGNYNFGGEFIGRNLVFDASGSDTDDILNYNFRSSSFILGEDGKLFSVRKGDGLACAELLGNYPIVTAKEARARLAGGNYQTTLPVPFPGEENIGKVELIYRTGSLCEILMPYYRFYVEIETDSEEAKKNGLKTYGAYYVPAITDEYIANMP